MTKAEKTDNLFIGELRYIVPLLLLQQRSQHTHMTKRTKRPFKKGDLITPMHQAVRAIGKAVVATFGKVFRVVSLLLCPRMGWIVCVTGHLKFLAENFRKLVANPPPPRRRESNRVFRRPLPFA